MRGLTETIFPPFRLQVCMAQHTGMIGSRVLAQNENRLGFIKIFKGDRSFSYADRWTQGRPARFVTHVRAVGQVVRAIETDEQLIRKGGASFLARPEV